MKKFLSVVSSKPGEFWLRVPGHSRVESIHEIPLDSRDIGWDNKKDTEQTVTQRWRDEGCALRDCSESAVEIDTLSIESGVSREIRGAILTCADVRCPYQERPGENDNEPLRPAPTPPSLEAEASITVV